MKHASRLEHVAEKGKPDFWMATFDSSPRHFVLLGCAATQPDHIQRHARSRFWLPPTHSSCRPHAWVPMMLWSRLTEPGPQSERLAMSGSAGHFPVTVFDGSLPDRCAAAGPAKVDARTRLVTINMRMKDCPFRYQSPLQDRPAPGLATPSNKKNTLQSDVC